MSDIEFIDGLIVKAPNEKAPDYVKAKLSIKRVVLIAWLQARPDEWVNADVKVSQNGKWYATVDNWKPNQDASPAAPPRQAQPQQAPDDFDDRLDF